MLLVDKSWRSSQARQVTYPRHYVNWIDYVYLKIKGAKINKGERIRSEVKRQGSAKQSKAEQDRAAREELSYNS